jgi:hypothetical protein
LIWEKLTPKDLNLLGNIVNLWSIKNKARINWETREIKGYHNFICLLNLTDLYNIISYLPQKLMDYQIYEIKR